MIIRRWGACFRGALAEICSRDAPWGSVELLSAAAEVLELLKRTPGESGSSGREFAAMMSAAGSFA
jgi:hypothetical protein